MFKRRTANSRQRSRMKRLEVRVMSPRIAWFGFLRLCKRSFKFICILALTAAAAWGTWAGFQRAFLQNPEFQLRLIRLNPNEAIDEADVVQIAEIDLNANLYTLNTSNIRERLAARPEIATAHVERHPPTTLVVHVTPRTPRAWIAPMDTPTDQVRHIGGLLVDPSGFIFPCTPLRWESARILPIIRVPNQGQPPLLAGQTCASPELQRAFRLLTVATECDPDAPQWIDHLHQPTLWSLELVTRQGTTATIGFNDQKRQLQDLSIALDHASHEGYGIATINLIPERNIPITTRNEPPPPKAIPLPEPSRQEIHQERRSKDLKALLNRG